MKSRISDIKQAWLSDGIPHSDMSLPPEVKYSSANMLAPSAKIDTLCIDNGAERLELMEVKHGFGFAPVIRLNEIYYHDKVAGSFTVPLTPMPPMNCCKTSRLWRNTSHLRPED